MSTACLRRCHRTSSRGPTTTSPPPFERAVIDAVAALRPGELATYGELAEEIGRPGSGQAVANVLRAAAGPPVVAGDPGRKVACTGPTRRPRPRCSRPRVTGSTSTAECTRTTGTDPTPPRLAAMARLTRADAGAASGTGAPTTSWTRWSQRTRRLLSVVNDPAAGPRPCAAPRSASCWVEVGDRVTIRPPFHVDYGDHISIGADTLRELRSDHARLRAHHDRRGLPDRDRSAAPHPRPPA